MSAEVEGFHAEPTGAELEPSKVVLFVPRERFDCISGRRPLPLHLDAELSAARTIAMVPMGGAAASRRAHGEEPGTAD